jgi:hypothetical protein
MPQNQATKPTINMFFPTCKDARMQPALNAKYAMHPMTNSLAHCNGGNGRKKWLGHWYPEGFLSKYSW